MKVIFPVHIRIERSYMQLGYFLWQWTPGMISSKVTKILRIRTMNRKDDGTYSQFSVVMILIYLIYGEDHGI